MTLLEQNPWWILPYLLLMLLMVHAMLEFTVSLLAEEPALKRRPIPAAELKKRLLEEGTPDGTYPLLPGRDCDLEISWETDIPPRTGRRVTGGRTEGHLRLLLDETRHELRLNLVTRAHVTFAGLGPWRFRTGFFTSFQSGPPTPFLTREIRRIARHGGWRMRPVIWGFQATHLGARRLEKLTPPPLRRLPARRVWGFLYPLGYILGMGYLVFAVGGLDRPGWLLLAGISAAWWGIWGFVTWMLLGFPRFWRS